jgi:hypothetical protein
MKWKMTIGNRNYVRGEKKLKNRELEGGAICQRK